MRTWARTVAGADLTTTYAFNTAGELSAVDYSDATPDVAAIAYDRLGRQTSVTDAAARTPPATRGSPRSSTTSPTPSVRAPSPD